MTGGGALGAIPNRTSFLVRFVLLLWNELDLIFTGGISLLFQSSKSCGRVYPLNSAAFNVVQYNASLVKCSNKLVLRKLHGNDTRRVHCTYGL